jgi:hypothetical protein
MLTSLAKVLHLLALLLFRHLSNEIASDNLRKPTEYAYANCSAPTVSGVTILPHKGNQQKLVPYLFQGMILAL